MKKCIKLIFFVLFFPNFFGNAIKIDPHPRMFAKYQTNVTHTEGGKLVEEFYINSEEKRGVVKEDHECLDVDEGDKIEIYHIEHKSDTSYMVFFAGEEISCIKSDIPFHEIGILEFLTHDVEKYVGKKECGDKTCDVWEINLHSYKYEYFATVDDGVPVFVTEKDDITKKIYDFNVFKSGETSFDEKVVFVLPVDPKTCFVDEEINFEEDFEVE